MAHSDEDGGSYLKEGKEDRAPSQSDIAAPLCGISSFGAFANAVPPAIGGDDCDDETPIIKRQRTDANNSCDGHSAKRRRLGGDSENALGMDSDLLAFDLGLPGCIGSQGFGSDGVDVPILLHPHISELQNRFFDDGDADDSRVLHVQPPTVNAIRMRAKDGEHTQTGVFVDAHSYGMPDGVHGVLLGNSMNDRKESDRQNLCAGDGIDGQGVPIRVAPSCAWLNNNLDKEKRPFAAKHVPVSYPSTASLNAPPAVESAPPSTPDTPDMNNDSHVTMPGLLLEACKPFRMIGTLGAGLVRKDADSDLDDRVLVPVDRDPARTNGAMALPVCSSSCTENVAGRSDGAGLRERCIVNVKTIPLLVGLEEEPNPAGAGKDVPLRVGFGVSQTDGVKSIGVWSCPARRKTHNSARKKGQSSETISSEVPPLSGTISNQLDGEAICGDQSMMQGGTTTGNAEVINTTKVTEELATSLIQMDTALNAAIRNQDAYRVLLILDRLASLPLDFVHLMGSGIGQTVTALRSYPHPEVTQVANLMVKRWRWIVQQHWQQATACDNGAGRELQCSGERLDKHAAVRGIAMRLESLLDDLNADSQF
ncbi:unnamed protein product [Ostreobium quekettii]|uniref:TFIIS N-terminal domain-containing protein n=1 Tax=Ostreobium quekettii TaxID=121088 RepID=A0A8S1J3Q7_9CHLO|nr:unnamed protein product [Ostreobium quekettii]|eukprot:evm.model.scf_778.7 EVM.evm.TU.scf_778.7   scf_778:52418-54794(-)